MLTQSTRSGRALLVVSCLVLAMLPVLGGSRGAQSAGTGSAAAAPRVLNVAILGDSYSAGNGA